MAKESKAQRVERIKKEKDGLDVFADIYRYATTEDPIDPEDIDRLKWYGLYTQNKNLQGDDPELYFMLRVKVEGGHLNVQQIQALGEISYRFARGTADLTTRQDLQFHWIRVKDLPAIFEILDRVGLSSVEAAGDCPRNIVTCPVNGLDHESIDDVSDLVNSLNDLFRGNREFSNLPRKFKIGVSGCHKHCISHEIQDLSFTAVKHHNEVVFSVAVGGGQASNRRIASSIGFVKRDDVIKIALAVATIYRDDGGRENRSQARLGHLIASWGLETFVKRLQEISGVQWIDRESLEFTPYPRRSHFGVIATRDGHFALGCAVTSGRLSGDKLIKLGGALAFYGSQGIVLTTTQNVIVIGIEKKSLDALESTLHAIGIEPKPSVFQARTLACTGLNFCKFAVSETKELAIEVADQLNQAIPDFSEPVSISINGCPNSCAHPHTVDIGFIGAIVKRDDQRINGFDVVVGGHLEGEKSRFGLKTGVKVTPEEIVPFVSTLIHEFEQGECLSFGDFVREKYRENLQGGEES